MVTLGEKVRYRLLYRFDEQLLPDLTVVGSDLFGPVDLVEPKEAVSTKSFYDDGRA